MNKGCWFCRDAWNAGCGDTLLIVSDKQVTKQYACVEVETILTGNKGKVKHAGGGGVKGMEDSIIGRWPGLNKDDGCPLQRSPVSSWETHFHLPS